MGFSKAQPDSALYNPHWSTSLDAYFFECVKNIKKLKIHDRAPLFKPFSLFLYVTVPFKSMDL